jgi:MFS family permease
VRLAFVGFLAAEVHSGGCSFNSKIPNHSHPHTGGESLHIPPDLFRHFDPSRVAQFALLIVAAIVIAFIVGIIFLYIGSVFRFILFDSVLSKHCSIRQGWSRWHRAGRRYFLWQIVFFIAQGLLLGVLIGVPLAVAAALGWFSNAGQHIARTVLGITLLASLFFLFILVAIAAQTLAKDFLVPIMALDEVDFADGWSRLLALIRVEPGNYVVYLLLKIVLAIAAGIIFGIITLIPILVLVAPAALAVFAAYKAGLGWNVTTVSLAIIFGAVLFAAIMFIAALISVPATVFFPAYSIHFFASRYAKLDALLNPPAPTSELPPVAEPTPPFEPPPLPPSPEPIG